MPTNPLLQAFLSTFRDGFHPTAPYRGTSGRNWLVSRVWSDVMREFLDRHYDTQYELPVPNGCRLDAAVWSSSRQLTYAIEWEWDHRAVNRHFARGDFAKVLSIEALCGIAIVHTRADGRRGTAEADNSIEQIAAAYRNNRHDDRPVGLIEIRRVEQSTSHVSFRGEFTDLPTGQKEEFAAWCFTDTC
jgi:hypothetical protein